MVALFKLTLLEATQGGGDLSNVISDNGIISTLDPSKVGAVVKAGTTFNFKGQVNTAIHSEIGSLINITGVGNGFFGYNYLGNSTRLDGVALDGNLNVGSFGLLLLDANEAVLGQYTSLAGGFVNGANGLLISSGRTVEGFGTLYSTKNIVNDGLIKGTGGTLTLQAAGSGVIKGVGIFDNVTIVGAFSPGHSPGVADITGNGILTSLSTFLAEMSGYAQGVDPGYDLTRVGTNLAAGALTLDGVLKLELQNGFSPILGSVFDIIKVINGLNVGSNILGDFASFNFGLAPLMAGLQWSVIGKTLDGSGAEVYRLMVVATPVPEPSTYLMLGAMIALVMVLTRRKAKA